ncbi:MAG: hypothetical protein KME18_25085 [Phormidium tanganyikae FI6-MK23]|jgi:hypothetical protein|nr:hypothetical protein [Phormidium tanganyikae FI6-MK23]
MRVVSFRRLQTGLVFAIVTTSLIAQGVWRSVAKADFLPYCQQTSETINQKDAARRAALKGTTEAQQNYQALTQKQAEQLRQCRNQNWLKTQAIWLRLYSCDARPGAIEEVLDRIVDRGYNEVYVETFFNGQVLLPAGDNPTAWQSMVQSPNNVDLLAQVIQKGRDRGLKVYAWMFSMNFGYTYAIKPDKQVSLLRNGRGQTSFSANTIAGLGTDLGTLNPDEAFIDPYSLSAKQDYFRMVQEVLKRKPDGLLFDYIRYPRSRGKESIATKVQDLWIFGDASRRALYDRGLNNKGRELIKRYVNRSFISTGDVAAVDKLFPREKIPMWQGRIPNAIDTRGSAGQRAGVLQTDLWRLSIAHAMQGVVDFLNVAVYPVQQAGLPAGAVFFPEGNQTIGQGFDSRLQPWDRFPKNISWHPMAYATCRNADCVVKQVQRVLAQASPGTEVKPVLAGVWQQSISNRPPLEVQMEALRSLSPRISSISHFAYSWQEPQSDQDRKSCVARRL